MFWEMTGRFWDNVVIGDLKRDIDKFSLFGLKDSLEKLRENDGRA